mmetsp:Transcript_86144/g.263674  ORF Transcript_86144/g.263674 Transcript_86144/m.263674 type:complete len:361 (+) Transcript_86144:753-1835(+)
MESSTWTSIAMSSTALSKHFSHEKPINMPSVSTSSTMESRTRRDDPSCFCPSSESAIGSSMKMQPKPMAVIASPATTNPKASPFRAYPRSSKIALTENMMAHAKMKLLARENSFAAKPFQEPNAFWRKLPAAKHMPITMRKIDPLMFRSWPSGKFPSPSGNMPPIPKRMPWTSTKDTVRAMTSSMVSSTSSSHNFSYSSSQPSHFTSQSRTTSVPMCTAHKTPPATMATIIEPTKLSLNTCCSVHQASIDEKPVMCPSNVAQHFKSSSIFVNTIPLSSPARSFGLPHVQTRQTAARKTWSIKNQNMLTAQLIQNCWMVVEPEMPMYFKTPSNAWKRSTAMKMDNVAQMTFHEYKRMSLSW